MESWLPVVGYEGSYSVSSLGRVWSHKSNICLRPISGGNGYLIVNLCKEGGAKVLRVHHLVAAAFIGPRPEGMLVLHRDDVKTNNALSNLRYGTRSDNHHDITRNDNRSLTHEDIREMRRLRREGWTLQRISKHFGRYYSQVRRILKGEQYASVE